MVGSKRMGEEISPISLVGYVTLLRCPYDASNQTEKTNPFHACGSPGDMLLSEWSLSQVLGEGGRS